MTHFIARPNFSAPPAPLSGRTSRGLQRKIIGSSLILLLLFGHSSPASGRLRHTSHAATAVAFVDDGVPMSDKVVAFARERQGKVVGDGECYDLADEALKRAGAKSAPSFGQISADADYVWGTPVDPKDAMPGDIVQFHGYTIKTTIITLETLADGRQATTESWVTDIREHHTAIVESNLGGELLLLEQNVEPGLVVQRTTIPIVSRSVEGSPEGTPNVLRTTYEVAGTVSVYRPETAHPMLLAEH